jgi:hypothetical protein
MINTLRKRVRKAMPATCRCRTDQAFRWWEIDISYYIIRLLGGVELVWDIRKPPSAKLTASDRAMDTIADFLEMEAASLH